MQSWYKFNKIQTKSLFIKTFCLYFVELNFVLENWINGVCCKLLV
jgi:hypothetical protein